MPDLETRLAVLGAQWEAPPAPDLVADILAGRTSSPARRRRTQPRRLVLVLAATAVAVGALAAIAPARNAILDFFDIGGVRIITTPTTTTGAPPSTPVPSPTIPPDPPPPAPPLTGGKNPLGSAISLTAARARATFPLRIPTLPQQDPDAVFVRTPPQDGAYAFVWRDAGDVARGELIVTQFRGTLIAQKLLDPAVTTVQTVDVDGSPGFWLSGGPHTVGYVDGAGAFRSETIRTVGDVLVWERAGVTYRIEGATSIPKALRIAASLR